MRARVPRYASILSVLLFAATVVMWVRSDTAEDAVHIARIPLLPDGATLALASSTGRIHAFYENHGRPIPSSRPSITRPLDGYITVTALSEAYTRPNALGFGFKRVPGTRAGIGWALTVPHYAFCALFAALPAVRIWLLVRSSNARRSGRCASCGYDLRATPDRCPECGTAAAGR